MELTWHVFVLSFNMSNVFRLRSSGTLYIIQYLKSVKCEMSRVILTVKVIQFFFTFFVRSCLTRYSFSYSWCGALCYLNVCYSNSFIFFRNMYIQTFSHLKNFLYWCHIKKRWISPSSFSRIIIQFSIFTLTSSYCIKMIKKCSSLSLIILMTSKTLTPNAFNILTPHLKCYIRDNILIWTTTTS